MRTTAASGRLKTMPEPLIRVEKLVKEFKIYDRRTGISGALLLGLVFFAAALAMALELTDARARIVFKVSVIYLPLLLGLLVYDANPL